MTHLSDTINKFNGNGYSTRQIAARAADMGHTINYSTVARYMGGKHPNPPKREALEAIAAALGTDVANLERAADLPVSRTPFELPSKAAILSDAERAAILGLIDVMVAQKSAATQDAEFHPERAGYDLAANHDDEARARIDWLDSLGEEPQ